MKVGVTGASGFIGRHLVKALSDSEHEVFKFVRRDPKNDNEIPPTIVISKIEMTISTPGILKGK